MRFNGPIWEKKHASIEAVTGELESHCPLDVLVEQSNGNLQWEDAPFSDAWNIECISIDILEQLPGH